MSGTLSGIISGDDVSVNYTSANFSDRHAENLKTVTVSGINIFGSSSSNYSLQNTSALTLANIAQKTVRASFAASDKVYDRETSATVTSNLSGVISGDTVTLSGVTANFSDKTASQNKTITVSSNISGTDSNNYFLENSTDYILASIIRKPLTAYFQALNKVYDGTSKVEVAGSSSDVISGDQVIFEYDKAKFIDDTIGTEKQVLVTGIFLSGSDAGNYELLNTSAITSATVAAPADVAGSVYYIDWSTPTYVNNGTSCAGCIDWRKLYEMLDIDETLKSIINWVNLSREDKKKSASREDKKSPGQKLL